MRPRDSIKNIRDYEIFLRSRGFSRAEARILATAFRKLPVIAPTGCSKEGSSQPKE